MTADDVKLKRDGITPIWIQEKNICTYGLQGDSGGPPSHVLLNKANLLADIDKYGFMNDFNDFKAIIKKFKGENILLIRDINRDFGEDWYFCNSQESFDIEMLRLSKEKEEEDFGVKSLDEKLLKKDEDKQIEELFMYDEKQFVARPWVTATCNDTCIEVDSMTIKNNRPLLRVALTRPRESFGQPVVFEDRNASDWMSDETMHKIGIKRYMEAAFNAYDANNPDVKLFESSCQCAPLCIEHASQTTWNRQIDISVQCEPLRINMEESNELLKSDRMTDFLRRTRPLIEQALQQNQVVNMYNNILNNISNRDNAGISKQGRDELKEIRTFTDLIHSKNRVIKSLEWIPHHQELIAVAPVRKLSFDEQIKLSGQVEAAYILVWDFTELIHPVLKLEAPQEIFCFQFNPTNPNFVIGGLLSGQVVIWDIGEAINTIDRNRKEKQTLRNELRKGPTSRRGNSERKDNTGEIQQGIPTIPPVSISHIEMGHRRFVSDITWLPPDIHINSRGQILQPEFQTSTSHQFVSIASDGQCLFWDIRFEEISCGKLPHISRSRASGSGAGKEKDHQKAVFMPIFKMQLNRLEGVGELPLCRMVMQIGDSHKDSINRRSQIIFATEEGEILLADWQARGGAQVDDNSAVASSNINTSHNAIDEDSALPEFVRWVDGDRCSPSVCIQKSPFFQDIVLLVRDCDFQIWKLGIHDPIFNSPPSNSSYSAGCWSSTRPALLLLGKVDGKIEFWDFSDSSYAPIDSIQCSPSSINSMIFLKSESFNIQQPLISVGDGFGNLHIYDVPQSFCRPITNEFGIMEAFLEREEQREKYVSKKMAQLASNANNALLEEQGVTNGNMPVVPSASNISKPKDDYWAESTLAESESAFRELEASLLEELGINPRSNIDAKVI